MKVRRIARISDCSVGIRRVDFYWLLGTAAVIIVELIFVVTHLLLYRIDLWILCWQAISWYYALSTFLKSTIIARMLWADNHWLYSMKVKIILSIFVNCIVELVSLVRLGLITTGLLGRNITSIIWIITEKSWDLWRRNY